MTASSGSRVSSISARATIGAMIVLPWLLLVVLPLGALVHAVLVSGEHAEPRAFARDDAALLMRTLAWHSAGAVLALLIAWPIGARIDAMVRSRRSGSGSTLGLVAALATVMLAPWILFAAWWTILAPGNPLHDWFAAHGFSAALRRATLLCGLVGWAWAPAALAVAWWRIGDLSDDCVLDRLDGVRGTRRLASALRRDRGGLVLAFVVVMLAFGGDTVCFDLAQEPSIGFELRSLEAQGASPATILRAGAPMALATVTLGGVAMFLCLRRASRTRGASASTKHDALAPAPALTSLLAAWLLPVVLTAMPISVLAWRVAREPDATDFSVLHGRGAINALWVALMVGAIGASMALAYAEWARAIVARGRVVLVQRISALVLVGGWALAATIPAATYASGITSAWRAWPLGPALLDMPLAMALGEAGRFGVAAVIVGLVVGRRWARTHRDLIQLDAPTHFLGAALAARRPMYLAAVLGGAVVLSALAVGEISVASRLEPPGFDWLASSILSAIHYQRPQSVTVAALAAVIVSAVGAFALVRLGHRFASPGRFASSHRIKVVPLLVALTVVASCRRGDPEAVPPLPSPRTIGGPGVVDGTFQHPRAIDIDATSGDLVVIDKTARVQRFDRAGALRSQFRMPEWSLGQPVGVTMAPDGAIMVPDTHYHRIIIYEPDGRERLRFGRYGFEAGEFIYPTDVALAPDGTLFIGEYGGNDRIQVFDREGHFLRAFGSPGRAAGQFERPQSLAFSIDGRELFVADCCNHRIQVIDPTDGRVKRVLGEIGRGPGQLAYPWAIEVLPDGTLLVVEWGNERVQRLDPLSGQSLALLGGHGPERGRLRLPWAIAVDGDTVYVVDMGNNRVQAFPLAEVLRIPREEAPAR